MYNSNVFFSCIYLKVVKESDLSNEENSLIKEDDADNQED